MPTEVRRARAAELTTESAVKLRPVRHFLEPTDREIEATVDDKQPLTKWSSDANFRAWCGRGQNLLGDYGEAHEDAGAIEVGQLRGDHGSGRTVYATFKTHVEGSRRTRDVAVDARGCYVIQLVAGPFYSIRCMMCEPVDEAQLTDQHGLAGFCATAEVLDWSIVTFMVGCVTGRLAEAWLEIYNALRDTEEWED